MNNYSPAKNCTFSEFLSDNCYDRKILGAFSDKQFNFAKVKDYLCTKIPNLPLLLEIDEEHFPENVSELASFFLYLKDVGYTPRTTDDIDKNLEFISRHKKLGDYINYIFENKKFVLDEREKVFVKPLFVKDFEYKSVLKKKENFAVQWLSYDISNQFLSLSYNMFLKVCCI